MNQSTRILILSLVALYAHSATATDSLLWVPTEGRIIAHGMVLPLENGAYCLRVESGDCHRLFVGDVLFRKFCPLVVASAEDYSDPRGKVDAWALEYARQFSMDEQFEAYADSLIKGLREHGLITGAAEIDTTCHNMAWIDQHGRNDGATYFFKTQHSVPEELCLETFEFLRSLLERRVGILFGERYLIYLPSSNLKPTLNVIQRISEGVSVGELDMVGTPFDDHLLGGKKALADVIAANR